MPVLSNPKHELFAQELAKGTSATAAYEKVGYRPDDGNASKLAGKPEVQDRVQEITGRAAEAAGVTVEAILAELSRVGFANMLDYMTIGADGQPTLDFSKLSREQASVISELTVETRSTLQEEGEDPGQVQKVRFKLVDKLSALDKLGRHVGLFKDRVEHTGLNGGPIETREMSNNEVARRVAHLLTRGIAPTTEQPTE